MLNKCVYVSKKKPLCWPLIWFCRSCFSVRPWKKNTRLRAHWVNSFMVGYSGLNVIWLSPMFHPSALCIGAAYKNLTACSNPSAVWLFQKEMRTDNLVVSGFLLIQMELFTLPLGHEGLTHLRLREWASTDSHSSRRSQTYWVSFSHVGMRVGI